MEKKKVLIVDDHPSIRFLLRSLVETEDFTVCGEAVDGRDAVEKAPQFNPDLILLDFSMPNMNGAQAAPVLKKLMPHVPIILFTMHKDAVGSALAAAMNVDRVIAKPDGMTKLLECMRSVLSLPPPTQLATVGPLELPIDPTPEIAKPRQPPSTEENPRE